MESLIVSQNNKGFVYFINDKIIKHIETFDINYKELIINQNYNENINTVLNEIKNKKNLNSFEVSLDETIITYKE